MASQSESFDVAVVGGGAIGLAVRVARGRSAALRARRARRGRARRVARRRGHARAGLRGRVRRARAARARAARAPRRFAAFCAELGRRRADPAARSARWSSRATATRPRRSSACSRSARGLGLRGRAAAPERRRAALEPALAPTVRLALDVARRPLGRPAPARRRAARARRRGGERAGARRPAARRRRARRPACARRRRAIARRRRSSSPPASTSRGSTCPSRARPGAPGQGPGPAPARPARARPGRRARSAARDAYLVPRGDGRYVLGATMEERGWDTAPTAGGVYELLRDLAEVVPGVLELEIEELVAGLRPAHARQPARDRPRRARGPGLGDRPLPQRHPARRRSPPSSSRGALAGEPLPELGRRLPTRARFAGGRAHEGRRSTASRPSWPTARRSRPRSRARPARRRPRRGGRGRRRGRPARRSGRDHELHEGARVEILRAIQGG